MKRVLIFSTTYFPLVGGAEVAMKEVTDRLVGWDFDLICAQIQPGLAKTEKVGNVTVHRVGRGKTSDKFLLPLLGTIRAIRLAKASDVGCIWSLMASYGGFTALAYTWVRPKTKMLLTLQEGDPLEHYARRSGRFEFLHQWVFRRADAVQAISHFLADWSVRMGFKGKPEIVPNGVDIPRFTKRISSERRTELRTQFGFSSTDVLLVTASRLSLKNGVDDVIRAMPNLPVHVKFVVAGVGEDLDMLQMLVAELGVKDRVVFLGKKSHQELPEILQACDIFIRASLSEGLGNSFLEAMAAGLPIIGTPVGGIPDFLTDGETGVFCEPRKPETIVVAVKRLMESEILRSKVVRQGSLLVTEQYDWEGIAGRVGERLNQLII